MRHGNVAFHKEGLGIGTKVASRTTKSAIGNQCIIKKVLFNIIIHKIAHLPHTALGFSSASWLSVLYLRSSSFFITVTAIQK